MEQILPGNRFLLQGMPNVVGGTLDGNATVLNPHVISLKAYNHTGSVPGKSPSTLGFTMASPIENLVTDVEPGLRRQGPITSAPCCNST